MWGERGPMQGGGDAYKPGGLDGGQVKWDISTRD
jgi:hypothetical protein